MNIWCFLQYSFLEILLIEKLSQILVIKKTHDRAFQTIGTAFQTIGQSFEALGENRKFR